MKESNILAGNVVNNSLRREMWLNTKGEYMKESSFLAGNVTNNFLRRNIWLNIKDGVNHD